MAPGWKSNKQFGDHGPGLYRCSLDDSFELQDLGDQPIPSGEKPILVFLHGTASSIAGSFGKLWEAGKPEAKAARDSLKALYGDRVFAFQHRSLTESPIANALALAGKIPQDAKVHLVSHSRGGLVGELLCLGECQKLLPPDQLNELFVSDRIIAKQIGLSPLDEEASRKRNEAYNDDRARLAESHPAALKSRSIKVERFRARRLPRAGTTLAHHRLAATARFRC